VRYRKKRVSCCVKNRIDSGIDLFLAYRLLEMYKEKNEDVIGFL
jgi:hypothetical protein